MGSTKTALASTNTNTNASALSKTNDTSANNNAVKDESVRSETSHNSMQLRTLTPGFRVSALSPYVGFDFNEIGSFNQHVSGVKKPIFLQGGSVHVGINVGLNYGFEFGWLYTAKATTGNYKIPEAGKNGTTIAAQSTMRISGPSFDVFGYFPIGPEQDLDFLGTSGISYQKISFTINAAGPSDIAPSVHKRAFGFRIGGGFRYRIGPHVETRAIVRYMYTSYRYGGAKLLSPGLLSLDFGVNYVF